ncbi:hypothetical protein C8A05DRAFT_12550 [Staphylotrichum tortipilum]|uniref:Uncharacterized protein n=1 Tax=Staphylotrichum tortipilum TaxID=2831512 RepID=A0AAN6MSL2_9PEZI|nr:hypothetical protein C8A05DRAFT_12550 [Staphylotrichum longicolle]
MQHTKALCALKNIFLPIHPPLPLNNREAHRLLESLKASFRAQLDKEHGWTVPEPTKTLPLANPALTYLPSSSSATTSADAPFPGLASHGSSRPTDRHMHAILNNPLFAAGTTATNLPSGISSALAAHNAVFEKAVSRGLMTLPRAQGFLLLVKAEVKKSAAVWLLDGLKTTGAGRLVMQWLRSSGQEHDLAFLANPAFRHILMQFAVAEGLDDTVWSWVDRLLKEERIAENPAEHAAEHAAEPAVESTDVFTSRAGTLLGDFVGAKSCDLELEGAYAAVLKAEAMIKEHNAPLGILHHAWRQVAWETTMNSGEGRAPPASIFNSFVALGQAARSLTLERAHINLYHPVDPSASLAVEFLSRQSAFRRILRNQAVADMSWQQPQQPALWSTARQKYIHHLRFLGLDTVQYLLHANQRQEASRLWELLESRLGWVSAPKLAV